MHRQSRSFKRYAAVAAAAALATPAGAVAMPAAPDSPGSVVKAYSDTVAPVSRQVSTEGGTGTVTVLLLAGGALALGLAGGVGGSRLVGRQSLSVR